MQFAADLEEYKGERGFYLPLDGLPFPLAVNNEELVQAVQQMASLTPEERQTMANNARQYSAEHFDKDALIDQLLDLMK